MSHPPQPPCSNHPKIVDTTTTTTTTTRGCTLWWFNTEKVRHWTRSWASSQFHPSNLLP
jgi:hypothetical protein